MCTAPPTQLGEPSRESRLRTMRSPITDTKADEPDGCGIELVPASTVVARQTLWAWKDRIPLGGATLLVGQEGSGKTTLVTEVLARLSKGQLAGDLRGQPTASVYATAEDSWERTLRPRLEAAGADLELVHFVKVDGLSGGLTIPGHLWPLVEAMGQKGARFLVLDPLGAHFHGSLDTHRDAFSEAGFGASGNSDG